MSKMHNLGTVFKFETIRVLKKPTFWLMALGFPLMFAALYGIVFWSQITTMQAAKELEKQEFSLAVTEKPMASNSPLGLKTLLASGVPIEFIIVK